MNAEEARRIRDEIRKQIKTPGYEKKERARIQSALHSEANQVVNKEIKTPFQIAFLKLTPPKTKKITNVRTGKKIIIYDREATVGRLFKLIKEFLKNPLPGEYAELAGLKKFVKNSANVRVQRNKSMMFRNDPRKSGHDVARQFAIDRYLVFEYFFPENKPTFFNKIKNINVSDNKNNNDGRLY